MIRREKGSEKNLNFPPRISCKSPFWTKVYLPNSHTPDSICKVLCKYLSLYFNFMVMSYFTYVKILGLLLFFNLFFLITHFLSSTSFYYISILKPIVLDLDTLQRLKVKIFPTLSFCLKDCLKKHSNCSKNKVNDIDQIFTKM